VKLDASSDIRLYSRFEVPYGTVHFLSTEADLGHCMKKVLEFEAAVRLLIGVISCVEHGAKHKQSSLSDFECICGCCIGSKTIGRLPRLLTGLQIVIRQCGCSSGFDFVLVSLTMARRGTSSDSLSFDPIPGKPISPSEGMIGCAIGFGDGGVHG